MGSGGVGQSSESAMQEQVGTGTSSAMQEQVVTEQVCNERSCEEQVGTGMAMAAQSDLLSHTSSPEMTRQGCGSDESLDALFVQLHFLKREDLFGDAAMEAMLASCADVFCNEGNVEIEQLGDALHLECDTSDGVFQTSVLQNAFEQALNLTQFAWLQ
eukprot:1278416-Rhodomonas_salina.1